MIPKICRWNAFARRASGDACEPGRRVKNGIGTEDPQIRQHLAIPEIEARKGASWLFGIQIVWQRDGCRGGERTFRKGLGETDAQTQDKSKRHYRSVLRGAKQLHRRPPWS